MKRIFLIITIFWIYITSVLGQEITGTWWGTLDLGSQKLRLVLHISENDGLYTTVLDSPDQGARCIQTTETAFLNGTLSIRADNIGMLFEGRPEGDALKGTFRQGGITAMLEFTKGEPEPLRRPQNPAIPYPYNSEDITFHNDDADITLAGTFTYPKEGEKFPAIVLITGSGAQNRDEEVLGHKPFLVISDYLTRNGIAVLRFDDRGKALSEGAYASATIQDFATDASAAMDYLLSRREVDRSKVGMLGHSEGGQIAFIVGGRRDDVAFIVTLAGPGVHGGELLAEQRRLIGLARGVPQQAIDQNEQLIEIIMSVVYGHAIGEIDDNMESIVEETISRLPAGYTIPADYLRDILPGEIRKITSPELMSLTAYDPAEDLSKINCPILSLNGEKDLQVPADMNLDGIRKRFGGDLTTKKYPGLNHLFQHAVTGLPSEYQDIEETVSIEVLKDIADWINLKTRNMK